MIESVVNRPIDELLSTGSRAVLYFVPRYQREFTWGKQHWEALFDDVMRNSLGYFLGSIICINQTTDSLDLPRLEVVDGQQRLTTLSLLFAAVYQALQQNESALDENQRLRLGNLKRMLALTNAGQTLRVTPQIQNNNQGDYRAVLADVGVIDPCETPAYAGNRKIFRAFRYFRDRIADLVKDDGDRVTSVMSLLSKVNGACIVKIEVASAADAYTLFESLNNRGKPLTAVDLIKNKLLAELERSEPGKIDQYFETWQELLKYLGDNYATQERFFRHYYNAFKDRLNTPFRGDGSRASDPLGSVATRSNLIIIQERLINQDARGYLRGIRDASELYAIVLGRNGKESWPELRVPLENLRRVQGAPSYLLLLYLLSNRAALSLEGSHLACIAKLLVCFFVRRNLTDTPPTRNLTRLFMTMTEKLAAMEGHDVLAAIREELISASASDETFREMLQGNLYEDNDAVARFVLCTLAEEGMTRETRVDLWERKGKKFVWTIEHIFPQGKNIPAPWVEMIADGDRDKAKALQQDSVHKLGNLTISGFNSSLGNKSFIDKRDRKDNKGEFIGYRNRLNLNAELAATDHWTVEKIAERTDRLADQTMKLFALDQDFETA